MNPNYIYTITLYNCIKAKDSVDKKDTWQRTVIQNCSYKAKEAVVQDGEGLSKANTYTVRIQESAAYRKYQDYCREPEGHFTISSGDIVILGECMDEINEKLPAAKLLNRYKPDAFMVSAFSDNTKYFAGKHYKLGG